MKGSPWTVSSGRGGVALTSSMEGRGGRNRRWTAKVIMLVGAVRNWDRTKLSGGGSVEKGIGERR